MQVHFIHPGSAYLPELQAYSAYLQALGHQACIHQHADAAPSDARVVWWICGRVPAAAAQRMHQAFHIHEYASASVPPLAWCKDRIKRATQPQPHYRLFQNLWVRQRMGFADGTPWELRDMGIAPEFLQARTSSTTAPAEYDMVYLGDMHRLAHFLPVFEGLEQAGLRTLLVGDMPAHLQHRFRGFQQVSVSGKVAYQDVPMQLQRARCGLNLVPNQLPYSEQTSTKLLEYCAMGLPVISTDYPWVQAFAQSQHATLAYLPANASASTYASFFRSHPTAACRPPNHMNEWAWPQVLGRLSLWKAAGLQS